MSVKSKSTWLVVGDGAAAEFYSIHAIPLRLTRVPVGILVVAHDAHEVVHNPDARHMPHIDKHHGYHQKQEDLFVERLIKTIAAANRDSHFDEVIIVLPPKALAHFRKTIPEELAKKIKLEVSADWTRLTIPELEKHLAVQLPYAPA